MRFPLEVDRCWGSNLTDEPPAPGTAQDIHDSTSTRVGSWEVVD